MSRILSAVFRAACYFAADGAFAFALVAACSWLGGPMAVVSYAGVAALLVLAALWSVPGEEMSRRRAFAIELAIDACRFPRR